MSFNIHGLGRALDTSEASRPWHNFPRPARTDLRCSWSSCATLPGQVDPAVGIGLGTPAAAALMPGGAAAGDGLPAVARMYNLYQPYDPVAYRCRAVAAFTWSWPGTCKQKAACRDVATADGHASAPRVDPTPDASCSDPKQLKLATVRREINHMRHCSATVCKGH